MRPRTAALDALVDTIAAERDVVEYLLFKLITLKLLFVADERRFLDGATGEVEKVIDRLRAAEQHREAALAVVADEWEIPVADLTLRRLATETTGETAVRIDGLQRSLELLADEIERLLEENRRLAEGGLNALRSLLDAVADSTGADIYTQTGQRHRAMVRPVQLDRAL